MKNRPPSQGAGTGMPQRDRIKLVILTILLIATAIAWMPKRDLSGRWLAALDKPVPGAWAHRLAARELSEGDALFAPSLNFYVDEGRLFLEGRVGDAEVLAAWQQAIQAELAADRVQVHLAVDPSVQVLSMAQPEALLRWLVSMPRATLTSVNGNWTLRGFVTSVEAREQAGVDLQAMLPPGANLDNALVVANPSLLPHFEQGRLIAHITFEPGSAQLTADGRSALQALLPLLLTQTAAMEIGGHVDDLGSQVTNHQLSLARAEAVYGLLLAQGFDPGRLSLKGYGATQALSQPDPRERQRRIEFVLIRNES